MKTSPNQKLLAASLFPINGLQGLPFKLRVLRVLDALPNDNYRPIRLQAWADDLWHDVLKCPVFTTSRFDFPGFIIPADAATEVGRVISLPGIADKEFRIEVTDRVFEIDPAQARLEERDLAGKMVERVISDRLNSLKFKFWRTEWTLYFHLLPENERQMSDHVNAYRGFKFGVVLLENGDLLLAADIRTKYIGRRSLSQYNQVERDEVLTRHLDLDIDIEERATFLRDNGSAKYSCRYAGPTGQSISQYRIKDLNQTVLEFYAQHYPRLRLDPNDPAVFFDSGGKKKDLTAPASRMFPVFTTEDESLRTCSIKPQMTPEARVREIQSFLSELKGLSYSGREFTLDGELLTRERSIFLPPKLEFGKGNVLEPYPQTDAMNAVLPDIEKAIANWRFNKVPMLYQHGPYFNEPLPDVVFFYPDGLPREIREAFLKQLELEILKQTGAKMNLVARRSYKIGQGERSGSSLLSTLKTVMAEQQGMFLAVVALWDRFFDSVHPNLKEVLKGMPSQCVTEKVLKVIANTGDPMRAMGRVRNLALGVLTAAGVQPWVLAESLNSDVYIGIDTLHGRVSYHFLFGKGGRNVLTSFGSAIKRGRKQESLDKVELRTKIESALREIHAGGHPLGSVVVHRDGRWWKRESQALKEAVSNLIHDKILPEACPVGVVEIRKSHFPVRLFTKVEPPANQLLNPLPGTYLVLDQQRVLLSTTGRPGSWDKTDGRTAGTLLLNLVESSQPMDIAALAEDAYRLTHLNWNAPDIEISVPVTIRWNDDALRASLVSQQQDEDETHDETNETNQKLEGANV
jgi:hypothetical protein